MPETEQIGNAQQVEQPKEEPLHPAHYRPYSVLTVGTELAVLSLGSPVRKRIVSYGKFFQLMHIVLMCGVTGQSPLKEDNVTVYPTNSPAKWQRYWDALRIGKTILGVDIVSAQDPFEVGLVSHFIAKHHRAPLHVQVHTDFLAPEFAALSLVNKIRVRIAGYVLKRASHIRVVSKTVAQRIVDTYGPKVQAKVTILPIYVDTERLRNPAPRSDLAERFAHFSKRLLVVSRFEPEKNILAAVQAFKDGAPRDACLVLLGSGSQMNAIERLITKLGLDSRAFLEGYKDPAPYYAIADLLLVPSLYEGYGQVIVEALAAGKPVLSTDVGIARESGAIITMLPNFAASIAEWFEKGPSIGTLQNYPYASAEQYVELYCDDIAAAKDIKEKAAA